MLLELDEKIKPNAKNDVFNIIKQSEIEFHKVSTYYILSNWINHFREQWINIMLQNHNWTTYFMKYMTWSISKSQRKALLMSSILTLIQNQLIFTSKELIKQRTTATILPRAL